MYKSHIHCYIAFVSHDNFSEVVEPSNCSLDSPSPHVYAKFSIVLPREFFTITPVWTDKLYTALIKSISNFVAVCISVINQSLAKHSSQRRRPLVSSALRNYRQASFRKSSFSHWRSRRQTVIDDGKCLGRSFQRAPLRTIQRTASKQARLPAGFCPPLADEAYSERCGSISVHCSSVTSLPMRYSRLSIGIPP